MDQSGIPNSCADNAVAVPLTGIYWLGKIHRPPTRWRGIAQMSRNRSSSLPSQCRNARTMCHRHDSSSGQGQSGECDSDGQDPAHECLLGRQNSTGDAGRYSRSFGLSASVCIAALRRVEKPPASPQQSPVTEFLGPRKAANSRSLSAPVRRGKRPNRRPDPRRMTVARANRAKRPQSRIPSLSLKLSNGVHQSR